MGDPARRRATWSDLLDVPDHMVGEIIDGELIVSPRPRPRHAWTTSRIGIEVGGSYSKDPDDPDGPGGWWILDEPELHLDEDILIPDLAGWRYDRLPELPDDAWFSLPPDWACEVLSPSTARLDRLVKKRIYAAHGVGFVWLVDPSAQTLEVLRLSGDFYQEIDVVQGNVRVRAAPFDAIELDLASWWRTKRGPVPPEPAPAR